MFFFWRADIKHYYKNYYYYWYLEDEWGYTSLSDVHHLRHFIFSLKSDYTKTQFFWETGESWESWRSLWKYLHANWIIPFISLSTLFSKKALNVHLTCKTKMTCVKIYICYMHWAKLKLVSGQCLLKQNNYFKRVIWRYI